MPGNRSKSIGGAKQKSRHVKAKKQKKRFMRSKDPIQAVLMWGVEHTINEISSQPEPSLLLEEDFKAFSKIRVENQYYNKEYLPGHFKFKEYCPMVFHDLRKRFHITGKNYTESLAFQPPTPMDSPGRSGSTFFLSADKKLVIKSLNSEEVALLHQILQPYHAHVVTQEGRTVLPHYLGMYRLTVNNAETYWIVMRNVFSHKLKMHLKFDLKGSTVDRAASDKEKAKVGPTLKDNDFIQMDKKFIIGEESKSSFLAKLKADVKLLQDLNLMDYSLLVGIHDCSAPVSANEEDNWSDDEVDMSGDELREDSPTSPTSGEDSAETHPLSVKPRPLSGELLSSLPEEAPPMGTSPPKDSSSGEEPLPEVGGATALVDDVEKSIGAPPPPYRPILVNGEDSVLQAISDGFNPVINQDIDIFAMPGSPDGKPEVYFMAIIDVLTNYGSRKRAAHAAKTMKHGAGAEISTVKPEQYCRRFLEFVEKSLQ